MSHSDAQTLVKPKAQGKKESDLVICLDIGSGITNALAFVPDRDSPPETLEEILSIMRGNVTSHPTKVGFARNSFHLEGHKNEMVALNGQKYFVGSTAIMALGSELISPRDDDWALSEAHLALVCSEIARIAIERGLGPSFDTSLVVGLPQRFYEDNHQALRERLQCKHEFEFKGVKYSVNIKNVRVLAQACGAYYYSCISLLNEDELKARIGTIDIGTYTTDFALMEDSLYASKNSDSTSIRTGTYALQERFKRYVEESLDTTYSDASINKALLTRKLMVKGKMEDVSKDLERAVAEEGDAIIRGMPASWDTDGMLILLAGGGAIFSMFGHYMQSKIPHARIVSGDIEELSNAIVMGYGVYALTVLFAELQADAA